MDILDDVPATIDWDPLGDVYYRKVELYSMLWKDKYDLNKYMMCGGTYGGPLAIVKEESAGGRTRATIHLFTAAGVDQGEIKWDGGKLVEMGWSDQEDLLCISEDGIMYAYDMFGTYKRESSFGQDIQRVLVLEAELFASSYGTGVCILTSDYHFYLVNNAYDIKLNMMQTPFSLEAPPSSWAVITVAEEKTSKLLMAVNSDIYELDSFQPNEKKPQVSHPVSSFIEMAVSFNQKYVAMFADTGLLWIGSSTLNEVYCQFNTHLTSRPLQMVWCGSGAVVGYWDNYLMVVGPRQDTIKYFVDGKVRLLQELDGVRIVGNKTQDFLHKVPVEMEDVYKLDSMKPGTMLLDASKEYERKSVRVDEYMKATSSHLREAIQECTQAAGYEFEPKKQRALMKAAEFGKIFLRDMRPQPYVEMMQTIRILNHVRDFKIGIPLTYDQYQRLTVPVLIDRLIARRKFHLAAKICDYLRISKREGRSRVLAHWACYKVQQVSVADEVIARDISTKLGDTPGISYTKIAAKALEMGRNALAVKLLDFEAKAADQVPLLLKMKKEERALQKAVVSGDTELVYMVLQHMRRNMSPGDFLMNIRSYPLALTLLIKYSRSQDPKLLIDIFNQDDMFGLKGSTHISESFSEQSLEAKIKKLLWAKKEFDDGALALYSQVTDEQIRLLRFQSKLNDEFGKNDEFFGLTLGDTLYQLIYQGYNKNAEQLRKDFAVPDNRYWWTKIHALAQSHNWPELERFSKNKKSPIGYEPFVEACMKYGNNPVEAEKYIVKVPLDSRVRLFVTIGYLEEAAETAFQTKNVDDLNYVQVKAGNNRSIVEKVNLYKSQLNQRR